MSRWLTDNEKISHEKESTFTLRCIGSLFSLRFTFSSCKRGVPGEHPFVFHKCVLQTLLQFLYENPISAICIAVGFAAPVCIQDRCDKILQLVIIKLQIFCKTRTNESNRAGMFFLAKHSIGKISSSVRWSRIRRISASFIFHFLLLSQCLINNNTFSMACLSADPGQFLYIGCSEADKGCSRRTP